MVYHCSVRQRLCTRVDPGLGQGSAERVPQPFRGQRLAPMRPLGHDEQPAAARLRPLGQQVCLDDRADAGIQRHPPFPAALARDLHPPAADVRVGHPQ
jgi:hypothetical protein